MKRVSVLLIVLIVLAVPSGAHADIAPPAQPPGSNLQPGVDTTQVRMLAETVTIDVQPGASTESLGYAHVSADFTMHNMGNAAENMAARFPVAASDGWSRVNEISDLQVRVAGKVVDTRRITGEDPYNSSSSVPWAEFDVTFPPGEDVAIHVEYTLPAGGEYPFASFKYILSSGAGWKDSIGSADIIVRLPYEVNNQNVLLDVPDSSFETTKGGALDGTAVRWHYADLEPTTSDNFAVSLVAASAWKPLLVAQSNVALNPQDGESWGQVGKLSKIIAFSSRGKGFRGESGAMDPGAAALYQQSLDAYARAVSVLPNDALWHAGYADLLGYHAYFARYGGADVRAEAVQSLEEIRKALELAPDDPKVQDIAAEIANFFPDGMQMNGTSYDYPWLTATPTAEPPTPQPTEVAQVVPASGTEAAVSTGIPITQPAPTEVAPSQSKPALPICGSGLLLPLMLLAGTFAHTRIKTRRD